MIDPLLDHVLVNWFVDWAGEKIPVYPYIVEQNITTLPELQRFLENPRTIQQLTCIDPTDRQTHPFNERARQLLLALPRILEYGLPEPGKPITNYMGYPNRDPTRYLPPGITFTRRTPRSAYTQRKKKRHAAYRRRRIDAARTIQAFWRRTLSSRPIEPSPSLDIDIHLELSLYLDAHAPHVTPTVASLCNRKIISSCITGETLPPKPHEDLHPFVIDGISRGPAVVRAADRRLVADMVPVILPPPEPPPEPPPGADELGILPPKECLETREEGRERADGEYGTGVGTDHRTPRGTSGTGNGMTSMGMPSMGMVKSLGFGELEEQGTCGERRVMGLKAEEEFAFQSSRAIGELKEQLPY